MKPQRFEIGQAVTLIKPLKFFTVSPTCSSLPSFGEVYHVNRYYWFSEKMNCWKIVLAEIPNINCNEEAFAPVISDSELVQELSQITEPVTI